ncbi:MAG: hypothetical protein GEU75_00690 [Dehalococcoidia bacterium]|nr:hypothetical protein [Dehalococcoidia bacterium]
MTENAEQRLTTADVAYGQNNQDQSLEGSKAVTRDAATPLLGDANAEGYSQQWQMIQTKFVDEPQDSVKEADSLVAEVIRELAQRFADQRERLEGQWTSGSEVSTEDLRQALRQYRSFFQRLLAA